MASRCHPLLQHQVQCSCAHSVCRTCSGAETAREMRWLAWRSLSSGNLCYLLSNVKTFTTSTAGLFWLPEGKLLEGNVSFVLGGCTGDFWWIIIEGYRESILILQKTTTPIFNLSIYPHMGKHHQLQPLPSCWTTGDGRIRRCSWRSCVLLAMF